MHPASIVENSFLGVNIIQYTMKKTYHEKSLTVDTCRNKDTKTKKDIRTQKK